MIPARSKVCTKCKDDKPLSEFHLDKRWNIPRSRCKSCVNEYARSRGPRVRTHANDRAAAKWKAANPGYYTEYQGQYYRDNKDRINARRKRWSEENGNKFLEYRNNRRALKANADGFHTVKQFVDLCIMFGGRCLSCGVAEPLTQDHIVPLSKGGTDWIWNIQPLCRSCNASKGARVKDYREC